MGGAVEAEEDVVAGGEADLECEVDVSSDVSGLDIGDHR